MIDLKHATLLKLLQFKFAKENFIHRIKVHFLITNSSTGVRAPQPGEQPSGHLSCAEEKQLVCRLRTQVRLQEQSHLHRSHTEFSGGLAVVGVFVLALR